MDNILMVTLLNKSQSLHVILKNVQPASALTRLQPPHHMIFHQTTAPRDGNTKVTLTMLRENLSQNVILKSTSQVNALTKDK